MRLPVEQTGTVRKIYDTLNDIFDLLEAEPKSLFASALSSARKDT